MGRVEYYPIPQVCPYCGWPVALMSNAVIYGKVYGDGKVYKCCNDNCDSYVGCHPGTKVPLGRLANRELRNLKKKAHAMFDWHWKKSINPKAKKKREKCYAQLATKMGIPVRECHFGWFGKEQLLKAIDILEKGLFS